MDFRAWLNAQADRRDAVGDLARELQRDTCAGRAKTTHTITRHLMQIHDVPRGGRPLAALSQAWREFEAAGARPGGDGEAG